FHRGWRWPGWPASGACPAFCRHLVQMLSWRGVCRARTWRPRAAYAKIGAMRAIWKGAVSFGLVNVPIRLYSATENHDVQFRQVHREDGGRIKYQRVCSIDGQTVSYDDIADGYETDDGDMVVLTDDDLAELPVSTSKENSDAK